MATRCPPRRKTGDYFARRWTSARQWREALEREMGRRMQSGRDTQWVEQQLATTPEPAAEFVLLLGGSLLLLLATAAAVVTVAGIVYLWRRLQ